MACDTAYLLPVTGQESVCVEWGRVDFACNKKKKLTNEDDGVYQLSPADIYIACTIGLGHCCTCGMRYRLFPARNRSGISVRAVGEG